MRRQKYKEYEARERSETTMPTMRFGARSILDGYVEQGLLQRTASRKNYWVDANLANHLGVEEPPAADSLLSHQARAMYADKIWVPVGAVLSSIAESFDQTLAAEHRARHAKIKAQEMLGELLVSMDSPIYGTNV